MRWLLLPLLLPVLASHSHKLVLRSVSGGDCAGTSIQQTGDIRRRIIGGNAYKYGEWPFLVTLMERAAGGSIRGADRRSYEQSCGATLISPNWVVTAAHCVVGVRVADIMARIGEHNLERHDVSHQDRKVNKVIMHPEYNDERFEFGYDIALLRLAAAANYTENVQPVCMPDAQHRWAAATKCYMAGWGLTSEGEDDVGSVVPLHVTQVISSSRECRQAGYTEYNPRLQLCAGGAERNMGSCEGDSGGPMVCFDSSQNRWELAGLVSYGMGICTDITGINTNVANFIGWMQTQIKQNGGFGPINEEAVTQPPYRPRPTQPYPTWPPKDNRVTQRPQPEYPEDDYGEDEYYYDDAEDEEEYYGDNWRPGRGGEGRGQGSRGGLLSLWQGLLGGRWGGGRGQGGSRGGGRGGFDRERGGRSSIQSGTIMTGWYNPEEGWHTDTVHIGGSTANGNSGSKDGHKVTPDTNPADNDLEQLMQIVCKYLPTYQGC